MYFHKLFGLLLLTIMVGLGACHTTATGGKFNGTTTPDGSPRVYQLTTNYAIHLGFGFYPVVGNASVESSVDAFTEDARKNGGARTQITNMDYDSLWYIFPPFSFIITPVITDTYGYVYR
ncbi:MAG: hypothetical protein RIF32_14485 [Leptospirales bacterium]|jgi:hypothetical protein